VALPAGYATTSTDSTTSAAVGYIDIAFNTEDDLTWYSSVGWNLALIASSPINEFICKSFSGLVAKSGSTLTCTIIPSTLNNYYYPVIVRVSNFQAIAINTFIELHLVNIPAPPYSYYPNDGWI
jgi:hypothetical protein